MPRHTYRKLLKNDALDLSQIFIGRQQQLDLFELYLNRWRQLSLDSHPDDPPAMEFPSPNKKIQGLVVLLYGRGGFGKTTLLRRYHEIASKENQDPMKSKISVGEVVDWEFAIEGKRGLFNLAAGQEIDAMEYFRLLCNQLVIAMDKKFEDFKHYQRSMEAVSNARKQVEKVMTSLHSDEEDITFVCQLAGEGLVNILRLVPFLGFTLKDEHVAEKLKELAGEGAVITARQVVHLYTKLRDKLGTKFSDYLEPSLRVGLALGRDLGELARNFPLLIFFDTYEEIDEGDRLLRIVMGAAGPRVGWVLAGRDNLWAGIEQRERSISVEYGYKDIVLSDRGLSVNFNAGDIGGFTLSDITEYCEILRRKGRYEPPLPKVTEEGAKLILDTTQGVPLAVKIAAGLYLETADLDTIVAKVEGKREIVDQMVRRYLLHTRADQNELGKLYALALLSRADQPLAVAAALDITPGEAAHNLASELSRLHRRYSFIFTQKEDPSLHQEVRHFLRLWLLERRTQPEIVAINERLKGSHLSTLKKREDEGKYTSLKERLEDDEWVGAYLNLIEQQFWLDPAKGVRYALPFMIAASIYRRHLNEDVAEVGKFFETSVRLPYHDFWKWAVQGFTRMSDKSLSREQVTSLEELVKLAGQRYIAFPQPLPNNQQEVESALWWKLGEAYQRQDASKSVQWYEKALTRLGQEVELREATSQTYQNLARILRDENKPTECIALLDRAIELESGTALGRIFFSRGDAHSDLKEYEKAIADYTLALELEPENNHPYIHRASSYVALKEYERALEDFTHAIELEPGSGNIYYHRARLLYKSLKDYKRALEDFTRAIELGDKDSNSYEARGDVYFALEEYEKAFEDYARVIELNPKDAKLYYNRGVRYGDLKEYRRAIEDYTRAIELDPRDAYAYTNRGCLYEKLKDYSQAIQDLTRGLELDPMDGLAYCHRGTAYAALKEQDRAIQDYTRALELDHLFAHTYYLRGLAYAALKEYDRATKDYVKALEMEPMDVNTMWMNEWVNMGKQGADKEMTARLETIAATDPEHYVAYVCRGVALGLYGKLKEGLTELERAITLGSDEWDAYFWNGILCAYYYQGRPQKAIKMIEKSLATGLPVALLQPLYWLEKDRLVFFEEYVRSLLEHYNL